MVELKEIVAFLESLVPLSEQDSWDNSGLQVGWSEFPVSKVGLALSVSKTVVEEAAKRKCNLLLTHHPLTISGLKSFVPWKYPSLLLLELVKRGIALYSLHTNLDVSPLGPTAVIAEGIGLKVESSIQDVPPYGVVGTLDSLPQSRLLEKLTKVLEKDAVRAVNYRPDSTVRRVAVCSGSGGSFIESVAGRVDVFVTGDVKYHDALKALDLGLTVFDFRHFGTERLFYRKLLPVLSERFPEVEFEVLPEKSPFEVVSHAEL